MILYILTFEIGLSTSYKELLGIYDTKEKAEEASERHRAKYLFDRRCYHINEIELNKDVKVTIVEW